MTFLLFSSETDIVFDFLEHAKTQKTYGPKTDYEFYSKRDNCGQACIDMITYASKKNILLRRVMGYFKCDKVLSSKKDFDKNLKNELIRQGYNFEVANDRENFLLNSRYKNEWKLCPHYWLVDTHGVIYDPSGYMQFIKTGLSKDLSVSRYIQA